MIVFWPLSNPMLENWGAIVLVNSISFFVSKRRPESHPLLSRGERRENRVCLLSAFFDLFQLKEKLVSQTSAMWTGRNLWVLFPRKGLRNSKCASRRAAILHPEFPGREPSHVHSVPPLASMALPAGNLRPALFCSYAYSIYKVLYFPFFLFFIFQLGQTG